MFVYDFIYKFNCQVEKLKKCKQTNVNKKLNKIGNCKSLFIFEFVELHFRCLHCFDCLLLNNIKYIKSIFFLQRLEYKQKAKMETRNRSGKYKNTSKNRCIFFPLTY